MNCTLSEVVEYCKLENPAGALMLTGEWGSGKTYFIEKTLKEELKSTHLFRRISMFGISDTDAMKKQILSKWLYAVGAISDKAEKAKRILTTSGSRLKKYRPEVDCKRLT